MVFPQSRQKNRDHAKSNTELTRKLTLGPLVRSESAAGSDAVELAAVITVTANCEGTLTLAGTVHVLADGKFAHDSETVPL
jgi:hypothetical protein